MPFDPTHPNTIGSTLVREVLHSSEKLGAYAIDDLLSFGMAGGIYKAHATSTGEACTLWVMPMMLGRDREFRKRLQAALPNIASLKHPGILAYRRMEWEGQRCCIEMDPVDGISLERLLLDAPGDSWPPLDPAGAAHLAGDVAAALGAAHVRSLCHHNLVPANIMVAGDGTARVLGFGFIEALGLDVYQNLASAAVPPVRTAEIERTLQSTEMRAPEVQAARAPTRATDIYCLALLTYFLLTGQRYGKESPAPTALKPGLHANWDNLLGRCLNPDPIKRPSNIQRLEEDLRNIEAAEPANGSIWGGDPLPGRKRKSWTGGTPGAPSPRKLLIGSAAALALVAVAGAGLLFMGGGEGEEVAPIREAAVGDRPDIVLTLDPAVPANVRFSGEVNGALAAPRGHLSAIMPEGDYAVRVTAANFAPQLFGFTPQADVQRLTVQLEPATVALTVHSVPYADVFAGAGAQAALYLGRTDMEGTLELPDRLLQGPHTLQLRARGYAPGAFPVTLAHDQENALIAGLEAIGVPVTLLALPQGARIHAEGQLLGTAPLRLDSVQPGADLTLTASLEGYRPTSRTIHPQPGEGVTVDFGQLERMEGLLRLLIGYAVAGGDDSPATVTINGSVVDPSAPAAVPAGQATIRVEHADYAPYEHSLEVRDRARINLPVTLQPLPGRLQIDVDPVVDYRIDVDGRPVPTADRIELPAGRMAKVEIQAKDFLPVTREFTPRPNETLAWQATLEPIPGPKTGQPWTLPYLDEVFVWIAPGKFTMGSPPTEIENRPNEGPPTRVTLTKGFWMMRYEVRQSLWGQLMPENPSQHEGPALPVQEVTWIEAMEFCKRLTDLEAKAGRLPQGYAYRLPTEAEWEYAARAGTKTPFPWGNEASGTNGNFRGSYPPRRGGGAVEGAPTYGPVASGSFLPNDWGLHDMQGNVAEWCLNIFNGRLPGGSVTDWTGPADGRDYPVRGGGWDGYAPRARPAARERLAATTHSPSVGFRIVLAPDLEAPPSAR